MKAIRIAVAGWTVINNNGVLKPQQGLALVDRSAYVDVMISLRGKKIQRARDWMTTKPLEIMRENNQDSVKLKLAPGGIGVVELVD